MTIIRTILAPLSDSETGEPLLETAFTVGQVFKAHVTALHVRPDPTASVPLVGEGMSGVMVEEMISTAEQQAAEWAEQTRQMYERVRSARGVPVAHEPPPTDQPTTFWIDDVGREEEVVAQRGRLFDLVVLGRLDAKRDEPSVLSVNAALMETGRPLLVAPPDTPATIGRHVAIAWNGSPEAIRAVIAAMPFLIRADRITVLTARESKDGGREDEISGEEFTHYLAWHRLKAERREFDSTASAAGEILLAQASECGADMLVMGAYTHGRLHNLIFGGVTRHVLHNTTIPVLMRH